MGRGDWQDLSLLMSSSLLTMGFEHNQHRHVFLRQYLESVLGLANNICARAACLLHSSLLVVMAVAAATVGGLGGILLRVGDGMQVEAINLEVIEGQEEPTNNGAISSLGANSLLACMTLLCMFCYQLSPPIGAAAIHASKVCASAMGILSSLSLFKVAAAVCKLVGDHLLKEVMSTLMASFSLLRTLSSVSVPKFSFFTSTSSSCALQAMVTMEFVKSTIWLLRLCGCHKKGINVLQEHMNLPAFCNAVGGGGDNGTIGGHTGSMSSTKGAGGWSQIKFNSYIATHLCKLWSSNDNQYHCKVLLLSATRWFDAVK